MDTTPRDPGEPNRAQRSVATLSLLFSEGKLLSPEASPPVLLLPGAFTIGHRAGAPGMALPKDALVSRYHAELHISEDHQVSLQDRGSANGTFVNGARIHQRRALQDGDLIRVGGSLLLLRYDGDPLRDGTAPELVGRSPAIRELRHALERAALHDTAVLLHGETGSGKEVAAAALHRLWAARRRANQPESSQVEEPPFIPVNCAAIVETLAESMFFGHGRASFSGAVRQEGYLKAADGGTLFLDEIGELTLAIQPKLLRALDKGEVAQIGRTTPARSSFRLIAATHRNLEVAVAAGGFREDLFARLEGQLIKLPPLHERREDVLTLLAHFAGPEELPPLTPQLAEALVCAPWPRNVRQLQKLARQLRTIPERPLSLAQLSSSFLAPPTTTPAPQGSPSRAEIEAALAKCGNVKTRAAALLEISRFKLSRLLKKDPPKDPVPSR